MKKSSSRIVGLIVALLLIAAGTWLAVGGGIASFSGGYANADKYTAGETTVSQPVENLDIHWISGHVNVEYHEGADIRVSETANRNLSDNDRVRWWLDGKTLRIQFQAPGLRLFSFSAEKTLTVSLPKDLSLKAVSIDVTSADVSAENLISDELKLTSTSGNLTTGGSVKKLSASATSGDIRFRSDAAMDAADLSATSGKISLVLEGAKSVSVNATSGDVTLSSSAPVDNLSLHTTSGKITVSGAVSDGKISSTSGSMDLAFTAFDNLSVDATSGDVVAALPETPGFACEIETTSGNVDTAMPLEKNGKTYTCGEAKSQCRINTTSGDVLITKAQ